MNSFGRIALVILVALAVLGILALAVKRDRGVAPKREARLTAWVTGYTFWDNTPPGSAEIARPVVHDEAGGTGTWDDPITLAVGFTGETWHFAPGTRFYIPKVQKYAVVEDLCASCGKGYDGHPHVDLYIGGADLTPKQADDCARRITAVQEIVMHPGADYPVRAGEMAKTCGHF